MKRGGEGKAEPKRQWVGGGVEGKQAHWPSSLELAEVQSIVLGVKTGRAVCCSQARDSTCPGKDCYSPPPPLLNLHSHSLIYLRIHHPFHQPVHSIAERHHSDSTAL